MRRLIALSLACALVVLGVPTVSFAAGAQAQAATGRVTGTAQNSAGSPIANGTVRLRSMTNGDVVATSKTAVNGAYSFSGVQPGNYLIELVDANGAVIATSMPVSMEAGSVTGVALRTATATGGTGTGAATGAAAATSTGSFFTSTGGIILLAAAGGGAVAGIYAATRSTTSPSQ